jgi:hypothetical protein
MLKNVHVTETASHIFLAAKMENVFSGNNRSALAGGYKENRARMLESFFCASI